jgi:predicted DNA binding protein
MATEATFIVPADQFPLGTIFKHLPDVTVELERIIPVQDIVIPYFWVYGTQIDHVERVFPDHPGVESIQLVDSVEKQYLLRVEWTLGYDSILTTLTETGVPLIDAVGTDDQWTFEVRVDDREDIAAFQQRCRELDIPITLTRLHALTPLTSESGPSLTDSQQEALALAYQRGYFNTPRGVTMADLGDELGITPQAVASRLRRGIETVVGMTLPETRPPE